MMVDDVGSLKIRPLSPELLMQAIEKVNEDPKRREADVQAIREWIKKQPHIIADPSDQLIVTFLRGCKFSLEKTKYKLDMFYTMKTMVPEVYKNRDLRTPLLREILDLGGTALLSEPDENGCPIIVMRGGIEKPGRYTVEDLMKVNVMMSEYILLQNDAMVINGSIGIMDVGAITLGHLTHFSPSTMKKITICAEEGYPNRPKGIYFINNHSFLNVMFKVVQSFSTEKINRRTMIIGKNYDALYENIPRRILPKEYGGEGQPCHELAADLNEKALAFNDWFVDDNKSGVDEKKRIGRPKTHQDLFGMEGSFRQLNVD